MERRNRNKGNTQVNEVREREKEREKKSQTKLKAHIDCELSCYCCSFLHKLKTMNQNPIGRKVCTMWRGKEYSHTHKQTLTHTHIAEVAIDISLSSALNVFRWESEEKNTIHKKKRDKKKKILANRNLIWSQALKVGKWSVYLWLYTKRQRKEH